MSTTATTMSTEELQRAAREHLWLHFTRMGGYHDGEVPVIVRGDGCYLEDANGKRYLDALAGLFSVNIGYGFGEEVGEAAAAQMRELPFYTNWSYAHPRAIELAQEVASLAPGDLNRVFFVSGGSEAVESAWKLARQYYLARGEKRVPDADETRRDERMATPAHRKYKAIARQIAYHGTTMGALSINGIPALRIPFEPLVPEVRHVKNTNRYHRPPDETEAEFTAMLLDDLEQTILAMGPETVCLVHMEPVQNAGGAFTPPEGYWRGVRALCDRYDILLSADEVITGFGRIGHWFGSERYDIRPDIVCSAKGLSSSYAAIGAVIATDRVMEPFLESTSMYSHGITFGGHPVMAAIALKNIEIMKRERIVEGVREHEDAFRGTLAQLLDLPIVGDLRGVGFFYALELVKDRRRARRSRTRSASRCCVGSSRRPCSSAG
jgi:adenosylmethionine-8-amino-7-oxononanoate aminotransferase